MTNEQSTSTRPRPLLCAGVTLLDAIITISVLAVLLAVATPSLQRTLVGNRATAYTNELVAAVNLARAEAVARRGNVRVCTSGDNATCRAAGDGDAGNWHKGWIVRVLEDNSLLATHGPLSEGVRIVGSASSVTFDASGANVDADQRNLSVQLSTCQDKDDRLVQIGATGRVSIFPVTCG
jgi:type IV fimbrial biogenesis protein FimT